jgi:hypothetical protein
MGFSLDVRKLENGKLGYGRLGYGKLGTPGNVNAPK